MGYGIMHIQMGGRHIQAKGGQAGRKPSGMLFDVFNNLTGELLMTGNAEDVSESDFVSIVSKNISSYAKRGKIAAGNVRIECHEEEEV